MDTISDITYKILVLKQVKGVGAGRIINNIHAIIHKSPEEVIAQFRGYNIVTSQILDEFQHYYQIAQKEIAYAKKHDFKIISVLDPEYPGNLIKQKFIYNSLLYVKGILPKPDKNYVTIIGNKKHTPTSEIIAKRITERFVGMDYSIVCGVERGIQEIAQYSAQRVGGHVVGILPCGLSGINNSKYHELSRNILDNGGALISTYKYEQGLNSYNPATRDNTMLAFSKTAVLIESAWFHKDLTNIGTMLKLNRPVFVVHPLVKQHHENALYCYGSNILTTCPDNERLKALNLKKTDGTLLKNLHVLRSYYDYPMMQEVLKNTHFTDNLLPEDDYCMFDDI